MAWVTSCHHVLGIEHLLGKLGYSEGTVLLAPPAGERGEAGHEEVQAGEGHHVDGKFTQVSIQLSRESQAGRDPTHGGGNQVVEVPVGGRGELEGAEADVVERLIVNTVGFICVLNQLVH